MNKEILEITKEFHDKYEKLASEYTYETREDTKVFDINSNNGKLMYATVNEIVSPILKENKILKENAEHNDKVVDKVNWENQLLKKENQALKKKYENAVADYETTMSELQELRKQLEEKENIACNWKDSCLENAGKIEELETQQKEFINYLEKRYKDITSVIGSYGSNTDMLYGKKDILEEIFQEFKV